MRSKGLRLIQFEIICMAIIDIRNIPLKDRIHKILLQILQYEYTKYYSEILRTIYSSIYFRSSLALRMEHCNSAYYTANKIWSAFIMKGFESYTMNKARAKANETLTQVPPIDAF